MGQCNGDDEHKGISFALTIIIAQSLAKEKDNAPVRVIGVLCVGVLKERNKKYRNKLT